jgi:hypothetical protein
VSTFSSRCRRSPGRSTSILKYNDQEDALALQVLESMLISSHPSEDDLETYVMGQMPMTDQPAVVLHVLVCPACCEKLAETFD